MWTDEKVKLLKKLWSEGYSASQIAAEIGGVTRNAVIGKTHRLGLSGRQKPTSTKRLFPNRKKPKKPTGVQKKRPRKTLQEPREPKTWEEMYAPLATVKAQDGTLMEDLGAYNCSEILGETETRQPVCCGAHVPGVSGTFGWVKLCEKHRQA